MARNDYTPEQRAAWQAVRIAAERARGQGQHSQGINKLPRYDAKTMNIFAPRPDSRPAVITPRDQWTPNQERIYKKIQADIKAARAGKTSAAPQTIKETSVAMGEINKQVREIAHKAAKHKGAVIESTVPSTCLASLSWEADPDSEDGTDGTATAEFYRGGDIVYDFDMTLDDFLDWVESDSIGKFGNDFVFD